MRILHSLGSTRLLAEVMSHSCVLASFPGPCPASRRLQYGKAGEYCKRREAGQGPGNEASCVSQSTLDLPGREPGMLRQ